MDDPVQPGPRVPDLGAGADRVHACSSPCWSASSALRPRSDSPAVGQQRLAVTPHERLESPFVPFAGQLGKLRVRLRLQEPQGRASGLNSLSPPSENGYIGGLVSRRRLWRPASRSSWSVTTFPSPMTGGPGRDHRSRRCRSVVLARGNRSRRRPLPDGGPRPEGRPCGRPARPRRDSFVVVVAVVVAFRRRGVTLLASEFPMSLPARCRCHPDRVSPAAVAAAIHRGRRRCCSHGLVVG